MNECIKEILSVSSGFLTPLIAILTIIIAYQQWKTNNNKLKFEKYDRKLHIYEEVKKIIYLTISDANVSYDDLIKYITSVSEADFIFSEQINDYINEIYKRGVNLNHWSKKYKDSTQEKPEDYDHNKIVNEIHKETIWFSEQLTNYKLIFKKEMDIRN